MIAQLIMNFNKAVAVLLVFTLTAYSVSAAMDIKLTSVQSKFAQQVELSGRLGEACKECEIIVDYGKKFLYAYKAVAWNEKKLVFIIKDLGKSLNVKIFVRKQSIDSNALTYQIRPQLIPATIPNRIQAIAKIDKHLIHAVRHHDNFGGKGLDKFSVTSTTPVCNKTADIFYKARIITSEQRFGDARIESQPSSSCFQCSQLKVRWYHEPTGSISYQLHIQRRIISGVCTQQVR